MTRRLLVITKNDFALEHDGGSKRTAALVRGLEARGITVDWVAVRPHSSSQRSNNRLTTRGFNASIKLAFHGIITGSLSVLKWYSVRAALAVSALGRQHSYDAVVIEHSQLSTYARIVDCRVKAIDLHNIEAELLSNYARSTTNPVKRWVARYEARRMGAVEARLIDNFDVIATVSAHDGARFTKKGRARLIVAPNGISEEFFTGTKVKSDSVVFVAHLGWRPNIDGAIWLAKEVWQNVTHRAPGLNLALVGRSPAKQVEKLSSSTVKVSGNVPSVLPYLLAARVATAPLLSAGGTRIKILEALATGTPVVSTSLGALGLEHLVGDFLIIADDSDSFADEIVKVASTQMDPKLIRMSVDHLRWSNTLMPLIDALTTGK